MPDNVVQSSVPVPVRLARRPRDHRGFIIPYFVAWLGTNGAQTDEPAGVPDFRIIDHRRMRECVHQRKCWLCGEKLGVHLAFVIGPMCCINQIISEPPSHKECAEYAMKVCPFLSRPRMRRNEKDLPEDRAEAAGMPVARNPGTMVLWTTRSYRPFNAGSGNAGVLFRLGRWEQVNWWKEGRPATRVEAMAALDEGYRLLKTVAEKDGPEAVDELERMFREALRTLP
jgi:hypothetical protein